MPGEGPNPGTGSDGGGDSTPLPASWVNHAKSDQIADYTRTPEGVPGLKDGDTGVQSGQGGDGGDSGDTTAPGGYTLNQFRVDLAQLAEAIRTVGNCSDDIYWYLDKIVETMGDVDSFWTGPAYVSFGEQAKWFAKTVSDLHDVLDEIVQRMWRSYNNFYNAEQAVLSNLHKGDGKPINIPGIDGDPASENA